MARFQENKQLVHGQFREWLNEPVFVLHDVSVSRRQFSSLTESPCIRAVANLHRTCQEYQIRSLSDLYRIGLDGLLRCVHVGERTAWVAAEILHDNGYDVERWMAIKRRKVLTWKGAVKKVHAETRKQKHG